MSTDITSLLGGGTTETLSNGADYPTTDVVNLTQQIIAINNDASLTPIQKQQQIDALSGISYNAVNTNPSININGQEISNVATPIGTIQSVINDLLYNSQNPTNPITINTQSNNDGTVTDTPPVIPTVPNQIVQPPAFVLPSINSSTSVPNPIATSSGFNVSSFLSQNSLFIIVGIIILLIILNQRKSQKIEYVKPQVLEAGR